jgi:hypothetical protein
MKYLGWIATTLSIFGTILNAYNLIICWYIWGLANILWIIWSYKKREYSQIFLWSIFLLTNIFGYIKWLNI